MLERLIPEVFVVRDEDGAREREKDGNQIAVIGALGGDVDADGAPAEQLRLLDQR